jgi:streptogramin lyase
MSAFLMSWSIAATAFAADPVYVFSHLAGSTGGGCTADGTGAEARFGEPRGVVVDSAGNVFVADKANHTIRKISSAGVVTTCAGFNGQSGTADVQGAMARFVSPEGLAIDGMDNLNVMDPEGGLIRKITPFAVVTTVAETANADGSAVAIDGAGNLYIVEQLTIRKISTTGEVTLFGHGAEAGSTDGRLDWRDSTNLAVWRSTVRGLST